MKTINVRELQKHVRGCMKVSQRDRVVVTRHGIPTALIIIFFRWLARPPREK